MRRNFWWGGMVLVLAVQATWAAGGALLVGDFDQTVPESFDFKDEKGSVLNASGAYSDAEKGKFLGIRYDIQLAGWGGWGVGLKGADVSGYRYLAFDLRGEEGGELFEVGLRDTKGQEKKNSISLFVDTPKKWQRVYVPLSMFSGINLASLDNLNLGFGSKKKGRIYMDNVTFEGTPEAASSSGPSGVPAPVTGDVANKVLVDGFDRANPEAVYRTFSGDDSQIKLQSSRILYDGDYSMEIQYQLVTSRPWGSWVSALRVPTQPLDWTGVDAVKIWVKGDGSDNHFRFRFTEADGQVWETTTKNSFASTRWVQVVMPVSEFKLVGQPPRGTPPQLVGIKSYELAVVSPGASTTSGAKTSGGRVWFDLLVVTGERLRGTGVPAVAPAPGPSGAAPVADGSARPLGLSSSNLDFSLISFTEYFYTPEEKSQVNTNAKLITTGKLGNFSARVELGSESQEYGQASSYIGSTATITENRFADVETLSYQVFATNLHPSLSLLTLGNQFVDYGVDVMAPIWGFKGISAEGDWERLNYDAFVLKHSQNSFSVGARGTYFIPKWQLRYSGVYWEQTGKQESASVLVNNQLQQPGNSNNLKLERLAQDLVYNVTLQGRLFDERIKVESTYGYNSFSRFAEGDFTDPFNPLFSSLIEPAYRVGGSLWRTSVQTNGLLVPGLELSYGYRDIDEGYKPHYRQNPTYYDDTDSDQWAHNIRLVQRKSGWMGSLEYDTLRRHSDSDEFQHKFNWAVGHYGYRGLDVVLSQEYKRYIYSYTSDRSGFTTDRNDKLIATEIYVRAQLTPRLAGWIKPRQDRIWHPLTNRNFTADSLQGQLDYYIANNAKLIAVHKISRYDNPANEPQGPPFDDNFTRVTFEVTF
ncbi:MAG: hypothetical protein JNK54_10160 [Elusimicrobia bacterium]|nr:hypothetical protein [Elusimicrobiota bacterium]